MTSFKDFQELSINHHSLKGQDIVAYCNKSSIENIREIGRFMKEWLSDDPMMSVRTSGSTGKPKNIRVKKQQMLQSAAATAGFFNLKAGQSALLCLPMSYIAGKMMVVRALYSRLNLVCIAPDSNPLASLAKTTLIDFAPLTPMQLKDVSDTLSIRNILLGGGPVSPLLEQACQSLKATIYHGYGMTETLSHIALRQINGAHPSAAYQALPGVRLRTDDRGCLVITVPFLDEPVITNDRVTLIGKDCFIWQGRADNIVNSGGIKLSPESIERKLASLIPERFFLAGLPSEILGEQLCLFIEAPSYTPAQLLLLQEGLRHQLDKYERPKQVFFIQKFSTTSSGKIQRQESIKLRHTATPIS